MSDKYKILFVCLGNICRSPAAEGIFRQMVEKRGLGEKLEADSAGTYAGHTGEQPDSRMRNAAYARGYLLTHRARQVRLRDFDGARSHRGDGRHQLPQSLSSGPFP